MIIEVLSNKVTFEQKLGGKREAISEPYGYLGKEHYAQSNSKHSHKMEHVLYIQRTAIRLELLERNEWGVWKR